MIRSYEPFLPPAQTSFQIQHFSLVKTAEYTFFFPSFNTLSFNTGDAPGSIVVQEDTGINEAFLCLQASLVAQLVKNPPAKQETLVQFLGQEDLLEKG